MRDIVHSGVDNVYMPAAHPTDDTRSLLARTAAELVREEGMADVGLRAVARRAGVSHGAPRRYFPTRAALLAAAARIGVEDLANTLRAAMRATDDPPAQLVATAHAYVEFARADRGMFELIFRHDLLADSGENLRRATGPLFEAFTDIVGHALPTGTKDTVVARSLELWTAIHGIATLTANRTFEPLGLTASADRLIAGAVAAALRTPGDR